MFPALSVATAVNLPDGSRVEHDLPFEKVGASGRAAVPLTATRVDLAIIGR